MNEDTINYLQELGLSDKEARVYIASLSLGAASVQKIAEAADIKRVTTYVVLESLINLGLISRSNKGKKTYFVAEEPVSLRRLIKKKEQELNDQKQGLEMILPELAKAKSLPKDIPNVKFYDTAEGIRSILNSFLASQRKGSIKELYGISNLDQLYEFFPEIKEAASNPTRVSLGIPSKFIYCYSQGPILKAGDKAKNRQSKYVDSGKCFLNGDISISENYVIILSLAGNKPIGVTIQSREIAKGMRGLFEMVWNSLPKTK